MVAESAKVMNSIEESCTPAKLKYDNCFNSWFRDVFLKGKAAESSHEQACGDLFREYQDCLKVKSRYSYCY